MDLSTSNTKPCFACYNKTSFRKQILCFQGELKDFSPPLIQDKPAMISSAHIICMLFHHGVEITPYLDQKSKIQTLIATNTRKISKDCYLEDCSICNRSHPTQCMIPCSMKNCEKFFHYECAFKSKELKKMKIHLKGHDLESYGCSCTSHDVQAIEQHLKEHLNATSVELLSDLDNLKELELKMETQQPESKETNKISVEVIDSNKMDEEVPANQLTDPQAVIQTEPYNTFEDFLDNSNYSKPSEEPAKDVHLAEQHRESQQVASNDMRQRKMILEPLEKIDAGNLEKRENIFRNYLKSLGFTDTKKGISIDRDEASTIRENASESNLHSETFTENSPKAVPQEAADEGRKKKKNPKYAELSEIYNFRKEKNASQNGPYTLRANIKGNKMLDFYTKITEESFSNIKAKTKDPTIIKNRREENEHKPEDFKKRQYWQEVNETHFRKATAQEIQELTSNTPEDPVQSMNKEASAVLSLGIDMDLASNGSYHHLHDLPNYVKALQNKEFLHLLWNTRAEYPENGRFLASYQLNNVKVNNFDSIKRSEIPNLTNFDGIHATEFSSLKDFVQNTMEAPEDSIYVDDEKLILDKAKFGHLLQLKSVEQITTEDLKEIVSKQIFLQEYKEKLRTLMKPQGSGSRGRDTQNDEIFEELLFLTYHLNETVIPLNNIKKEKIREHLKKDESNLVAIGRLQERSKKVESELRFKTILKYLKEGLRDKTQSSMHFAYFKTQDEKVVQNIETSHPKSRELLKDDTAMLEICQNLDVKFKNSFKGILRKGTKVETDCQICFSSQTSDSNPIIYCSNCDISFHQYCYGVSRIPNEDFFCDVCSATGNVSKKPRQADGKAAKKANPPAPYACRLCPLEHFPLRKVRKSEWYHLTCLLTHRLVSFKNSEYVVHSSEEIEALIEDNSAKDHRCSLCNQSKGLCVPCAAQQQGANCDCFFHPLCAYVEGNYIEYVGEELESDDTETSGKIVNLFCNAHCPVLQRDPFKQKYYRLLAINYGNAAEFRSFEDFRDNRMHIENSISGNHYQDSHQEVPSLTLKKANSKKDNGFVKENWEDALGHAPKMKGVLPSKKVKK